MNIPLKHLSVRVPWHDSGWNGKVCCKPLDNGSCMFLPRVNQNKNPDAEESIAEQWMHELSPEQLPPCVGEKVSFMSPHDIYKKVKHPYSGNDNNSEFYGHYLETDYRYPGYSFSAIPYNWMLKDSKTDQSKKAIEFEISYDVDKEPELSFDNSWVQELSNQTALLDAFIKPIIAGKSLVFIYAKNIPFVDTTSRILIGVGHIADVGKLTEYEYDKSMNINFRSTLWERPVFHTIREDFENGFLLPYQEFFKLVEIDDTINIEEHIAFAPSFEEFSFGSEWVSNDSAIESLLILHEKLTKFQEILPDKNYEQQFKWIEKELSRTWKMRGPFPGLGAVLSGLKIPQGNLIAWELDKLIRDDKTEEVIKNPWDFVELLFTGNNSFLSEKLHIKIDETLSATWKNFSNNEKQFLQLLSRMNIDNDQVDLVIDVKEKDQLEYLKNPYLLYEETRLEATQFTFALIDKAIFAEKKILEKFPLSELTDISTELDKRRIRALTVQILETEAIEGHTLLTDSQLATRFDEQPLQPLCNPSIRNLISIEEFLQAEIVRNVLDQDEELYYFKLKRLNVIKDKIKGFVQKRIRRSISPEIKANWLNIVEQEFGAVDLEKPDWHQKRDILARNEKAEALDMLANSRVSVLIGPAGTGKTTLLKIFCEQPFIQSGTVLRLAPTGKARVNMGKDAMTLATFLYGLKRYDPETQTYFVNPLATQVKYDTVIVDESSMLTEDQLAALIDSLTGVERFILVGDYRQLPPIGAGRPFVDIIEYLNKQKKGVAELRVLFRQYSDVNVPEIEPERIDVRLSKWFSDDEIKKQEIDIFKEINESHDKAWENMKFIEWYNVKHLEEIIIDITNEEISNLLKKNPAKVLRNEKDNFDASLGAKYLEEYKWSSFDIGSAKDIENWQVLSPTRTAGYGTKVLNQKIQKTFRGKAKEKAIFPGKYWDWKTKSEKFAPRKQPKPIGDDGIIYGDKIINLSNTWWRGQKDYIYNPKKVEKEKILRYFANGEIGIHIGAYGYWNDDDKGFKRPVYIEFSSQQGYAYSFQDWRFQEDGKIKFELAYAITVHKAQGSGFNTVLFILPNPCPILSRELLYTALTRQEDRIVILHQGSFIDFRKFTSGEYSETGKRLTDLMSEPELKIVNKKYYDSKYVQVSEKGEFMISKSEVIIADKLLHNNIPYAYETAITDDRGITIHPDFTIEDSDSGITYYWEHLGMLTKDDYRSKWKRKQEWYERNNVVEYTINPDADKQLIITRDKPDGGIDSSEIKEILEKIF